MRWSRGSRSEPLPEPGAEVTYDWPEGGGAPYDVSDDQTRWVLLASSRFGRTWPAGDLMDFGSHDPSFEKRVPVGYMTITAVERLAVLAHGRVLREWSGTRHHPAGTTFVVSDGRGGERAPDGSWISHVHSSYDEAMTDARNMSDRQALVGRILVERHWH